MFFALLRIFLYSNCKVTKHNPLNRMYSQHCCALKILAWCAIALDNLFCISLLPCSQNMSTRKVLPETANLIRQLKYVFAVSSSSHAFSFSKLEAANYVEHLCKVHYLFMCLVLLSPNWRSCQRQSRLVKMPWTSSVCK